MGGGVVAFCQLHHKRIVLTAMFCSPSSGARILNGRESPLVPLESYAKARGAKYLQQSSVRRLLTTIPKVVCLVFTTTNPDLVTDFYRPADRFRQTVKIGMFFIDGIYFLKILPSSLQHIWLYQNHARECQYNDGRDTIIQNVATLNPFPQLKWYLNGTTARNHRMSLSSNKQKKAPTAAAGYANSRLYRHASGRGLNRLRVPTRVLCESVNRLGNG